MKVGTRGHSVGGVSPVSPPLVPGPWVVRLDGKDPVVEPNGGRVVAEVPAVQMAEEAQHGHAGGGFAQQLQFDGAGWMDEDAQKVI